MKNDEESFYLEGDFGDGFPDGIRGVKVSDDNIDDVAFEVGFNNTRKILFGKVTYEQLLGIAHEKNLLLFLGHDPDEGITDEVIDDMLGYYEYTEQYEICVEIRDFLLARDSSLEK
jgi:hypothetical protein